jgi:hypothetical protein
VPQSSDHARSCLHAYHRDKQTIYDIFATESPRDAKSDKADGSELVLATLCSAPVAPTYFQMRSSFDLMCLTGLHPYISNTKIYRHKVNKPYGHKFCFLGNISRNPKVHYHVCISPPLDPTIH